MNKFGGIDLNTNNSVIAVSHDADRIVYQRRLSNPQTILYRSGRLWRCIWRAG